MNITQHDRRRGRLCQWIWTKPNIPVQGTFLSGCLLTIICRPGDWWRNQGIPLGPLISTALGWLGTRPANVYSIMGPASAVSTWSWASRGWVEWLVPNAQVCSCPPPTNKWLSGHCQPMDHGLPVSRTAIFLCLTGAGKTEAFLDCSWVWIFSLTHFSPSLTSHKSTH